MGIIMNNVNYVERFLSECKEIIDLINTDQIEKMIDTIIEIRRNNGRIFFIGVGGGAGNATHAVNDFRKIAGIESYTPTDNVSVLTARINDDGWDGVFVEYLKRSQINDKDGVFVFSVGGGNQEKNISTNIVKALEYTKEIGGSILGVVGRDGGYTSRVADACLVIPTVNNATITPQTESFQAVIWHLIVSHPDICKYEMKWEQVDQMEEEQIC